MPSAVCCASSDTIFNLGTLIRSRSLKSQCSTEKFVCAHLHLHSNSSNGESNSETPQLLTNETVLETLSSYENDWKKAIEFFNWTETPGGFEHNVITYNRAIDILAKYSRFSDSWRLIHRMARNSVSAPNHVTFRIMFNRYASARRAREAIEAFKRAEKFKLKDEISLSNLIDALCEHKQVAQAEEICMRRRLWSNTKMKNMILRGWLKIGMWRKCREVWEEMEEKDLHSYSIYMDILCKSGKPWKAVRLYEEMRRKKMKLDAIAYNTVIRSVGSCEGVDAALAMYRDMIEDRCEPNAATYNTLIKLLCENYRSSEAEKMIEIMRERGVKPSAVTYHCLFGSSNKPGEILRVFEEMTRTGVRPMLDTYIMLLRKFGRSGFLRPVLAVWKKMEELGCSPDVVAYDAFIDALLAKGMVDLARKYDQEKLAKGLSTRPRVHLTPEPTVQDLKH